MYDSRLNCDNDSSIDFDFFEADGNQIKVYGNLKQNDSSKIVTKAVIETNNLKLERIPKCADSVKGPQLENKESIQSHLNNEPRNIDVLLSPTSSTEKGLVDDKCLDSSIFNCLAYNDYDYEQDLSSYDKECSDNSLSESTITSITSNLTSVSPLSCMSDSSCSSEEYTDSTSPQSERNSTSNDEGKEDGFLNDQLLTVNEDCLNKDYNTTDSDNNCNDTVRSGEFESANRYIKENELSCLTERETNISVHILEEELGDISIGQSSSYSVSLRTPLHRRTSKLRIRKKESNLTFTREELIKIERDNLILLKKIMAHSKPKTVSLHQPFTHKKTSAAINRAKQQKKIEQDNYILYSKISAMTRMKKVF